MRYQRAEKMEIIRIVENSELSVRKTLEELNVNRSSFYNWYRRYRTEGYGGLKNKDKGPKRFWNKIPDTEKDRIVEIALEEPEKSPRELAWHITDTEGYYISESSVYRILKRYDLITSPAFIVLSASDKFKDPTHRINELWQTDFTYFKISGWGWYYLATVLDDYSRYAISWRLFKSMKAEDVKIVLDMALEATGIEQVKVHHRPRLLTDNGPCYWSDELKDYLNKKQIEHTRGAPYHPQTQGKIERFHRSMKNIVKLDNYYYPWDLEAQIERFIDYYNNERYHESLNNVTPADMYFGRFREIVTNREKIKKMTLQKRKKINLKRVV